MGDVGIEEELDLIGVPHFGGPKVRLFSEFSCVVVCMFFAGMGGGGVLFECEVERLSLVCQNCCVP